MQRLKQILLVLILALGVLVSLSLTGKEEAFTTQEETSCSNLGNKVICPVTGEAFSITEKSEKAMYQGKVYYFCCPGCKTPFEKERHN